MQLKYLLITILIIISIFQAQSQSSYNYSKSPISQHIEYFHVNELVQQMKQYSLNITFNSTREKYNFIFYPLMVKCVQSIGEQFQPLFDSVAPGGIGAASYGLAVGAKLAVKIGIMKLGITGLIKAATTAAASTAALPIAIGVGTLAYLYNKGQKNQIKIKCRLVVKQINKIITKEEYLQLGEIKATQHLQLLQKAQKMNIALRKMKEINQKIQNYPLLIKDVEIKQRILSKYFKVFQKLTIKH